MTSPSERQGVFGKSYFLGKGYCGCPLSYFMNALDFGQPIDYRTQQSIHFSWYRKKHGQTCNKITWKCGLSDQNIRKVNLQ